MIRTEGLDQVRDCLAESSSLADSFAAGGIGFPDAVQQWLTRLETSIRDAQLGVAPRIASLRVSLEAARQGVVPGEIELYGRLTPRKIRKAAAQFALRSAIDLVWQAIEPFDARRRRAEEIALEVASGSFEKGLWPGQGRSPGSPTDMPTMWTAMLADPDLGPRVRELSALLGMSRALMAVAGAMNAFAGNGP